MDRVPPELAVGGLQWKQVSYPRFLYLLPLNIVSQDTKQKPHVRCYRNIQVSFRTQKRELHQAWVLPVIVLLLPLPVRSFARVMTTAEGRFQNDRSTDRRERVRYGQMEGRMGIKLPSTNSLIINGNFHIHTLDKSCWMPLSYDLFFFQRLD